MNITRWAMPRFFFSQKSAHRLLFSSAWLIYSAPKKVLPKNSRVETAFSCSCWYARSFATLMKISFPPAEFCFVDNFRFIFTHPLKACQREREITFEISKIKTIARSREIPGFYLRFNWQNKKQQAYKLSCHPSAYQLENADNNKSDRLLPQSYFCLISKKGNTNIYFRGFIHHCKFAAKLEE